MPSKKFITISNEAIVNIIYAFGIAGVGGKGLHLLLQGFPKRNKMRVLQSDHLVVVGQINPFWISEFKV
jgi:Na+-translocating ferredoxin:NAD+ oxidoreductase RnfC subunit